ncbi:hypothetical protein PsYK624_166930 [Phanerochaete sordida]|uniref:Uncharacterized protein n=1 Tax=Phanerochaete sordida TaxID=48140 RepID=A0A9P3LND6_9APHY|nr:hypothetical protein PsYK624_166930 [Phanerochaete sordida]
MFKSFVHHRKIPISLPEIPQSKCKGVKYYDEETFDEFLKDIRKENSKDGESAQPVKKKRAVAGEGVDWGFLEDVEDNPLSVKRGDRICSFARGLQEEVLMEFSDDKLPSTCKAHMPLYHCQGFIAAIESEFEELRYCSNHWKAEKVAIYIYSTWQTSRRKAAAKARNIVKNEDPFDADALVTLHTLDTISSDAG